MGNETILDTASKRRSEEDERRGRELKKKDKQKPLREKQTLVAELRHFGEVAPPLIRSEIGEHVGSNLILSKRSPRIVSTLLPPPQIKIQKSKFILSLCAPPAVKREWISAPMLRESSLYKVRLAHIPTPVISSKRIERPILSMEQCKIMFPSVVVTQVTSHKLGVKSLVKHAVPTRERIAKTEQAITKISSKLIGNPENVPSSVIDADEEIPELLNLIFSIAGGKINSGKAKVLCVTELQGDSHIAALATICARIYQENVGGMPKPIKFRCLTNDFKNELIKWMKAEDNIFWVQLEEKDWKKLDDTDWDHILERIDELFIQGLGFIIFNEQIKRSRFPIEHHTIEILDIKPQKLDYELKNSISSMIWGFVESKKHGTFDSVFESAKKKFEDQLEKGANETPYNSVTKRHGKESNGKESDLHLEIKVFLVRYLTKCLGLEEDYYEIKNEIRVEEECSTTIPDIWVPTRSEVYEVETLFGEGNYSIKKIEDTIDKYDELPKIKKINIVLDNLTFLMHIKELGDMDRIYNDPRKGRGGANGRYVEFYTLDLQNNSLVSMKRVINHLKQLQKILPHRELYVGEAKYVDMC